MDWQPIRSVPAESYPVLVAWSDGLMQIIPGKRAREIMDVKTDFGTITITHWQLLPELPKLPK